MKAKWIIENFSKDKNVQELIEEVKKQGHVCEHVGAVQHIDFNTFDVHAGECVIFLGSIGMAKLADQHFGITCHPITWCNWRKFWCSEYYPRLHKHLFNDKHIFMPHGLLVPNKYFIYGNFAKEATIFLRPDSGEKEFQGALLNLEDLERYIGMDTKRGVDPSLMTVVSTPKTIKGEWRFVVNKDYGIIAKSTYQFNGQRCYVPGAPQGAINKVKEIMADGYHPAPVYCIDICEDSDGQYWLLELTSFNSAGLYECNKPDVVRVVSEIALAEWKTWATNNTTLPEKVICE